MMYEINFSYEDVKDAFMKLVKTSSFSQIANSAPLVIEVVKGKKEKVASVTIKANWLLRANKDYHVTKIVREIISKIEYIFKKFYFQDVFSIVSTMVDAKISKERRKEKDLKETRKKEYWVKWLKENKGVDL